MLHWHLVHRRREDFSTARSLIHRTWTGTRTEHKLGRPVVGRHHMRSERTVVMNAVDIGDMQMIHSPVEARDGPKGPGENANGSERGVTLPMLAQKRVGSRPQCARRYLWRPFATRCLLALRTPIRANPLLSHFINHYLHTFITTTTRMI